VTAIDNNKTHSLKSVNG